MRVATWNVNSLKARLDRVMEWLDRGQPDVLLMQETKLADDDAPLLPFKMRGYELVHHGEGRWNGVAILSRLAIEPGSIETNFGDGPVRNSAAGSTRDFAEEDFNPFDEARMVSAVAGGVRFVSLYAPNGRVVGSPFYDGKLAWFERLARWLGDGTPREPSRCSWAVTSTSRRPTSTSGIHARRMVARTCRSLNVTPSQRCSRWDSLTPTAPTGPSRSASPGGTTAPATSTRTWACASTTCCCRHRSPSGWCWAEIDREARKGVPVPSDHAPLLIDIDAAGAPLDAGWEGALGRIAARTRPRTA